MPDYSFNLTAGDLSGVIVGYFKTPATGSIDAEPISVSDSLIICAAGSPTNGFELLFSHDVTSLLAGKTVWVDGVEYPPDNTDWTYNSGGDNTLYLNSSTSVFVAGNTYLVEIKTPPPVKYIGVTTTETFAAGTVTFTDVDIGTPGTERRVAALFLIDSFGTGVATLPGSANYAPGFTVTIGGVTAVEYRQTSSGFTGGVFVAKVPTGETATITMSDDQGQAAGIPVALAIYTSDVLDDETEEQTFVLGDGSTTNLTVSTAIDAGDYGAWAWATGYCIGFSGTINATLTGVDTIDAEGHASSSVPYAWGSLYIPEDTTINVAYTVTTGSPVVGGLLLLSAQLLEAGGGGGPTFGDGAGATTGTGAATATSEAIAESTASSTGTSTATWVGRADSDQSGNFAVEGAGAATAVGSPLAAGIASAAGVASSSVVSSADVGSVASATGVATSAVVGYDGLNPAVAIFVFPASGRDATGVGTTSWSNPGNVTADDGANATATVPTTGATHYLVGDHFDFTSVLDEDNFATVTGLQARIEWGVSGSALGAFTLSNVHIGKDDSTLGTGKIGTTKNTPGSSFTQVDTLGGQGDLWGLGSVDYSELTANTFQLRASISNGTQFPQNFTGFVDYYEVKVYYKAFHIEASAIGQSTVVGNVLAITDAVASSVGTSTTTGLGLATDVGVAEAAGLATVVGAIEVRAFAAATSAGVAAVDGIGRAEGVQAHAVAGATADAVSAALKESAFASIGRGRSNWFITSVADSVGTAAGAATSAVEGNAVVHAVAESEGSANQNWFGDSIYSSIASSTGIAAVAALGTAGAAGIGAATGQAALSAVTAALKQSIASAAGHSFTMFGLITVSFGAGISKGSATVSGQLLALTDAAFAAEGIASSTMIGASTSAKSGTTSGVATCKAIGDILRWTDAGAKMGNWTAEASLGDAWAKESEALSGWN